MDKNPLMRTVINKTEDVGADNPFRTFNYELIGGEPNMNVEVSEQQCIFNFDYSKVYWNSKLQGEHTRLTKLFQPGEVIADVMAGVGPFAVPAGKKQSFVWANDLNPDSFDSLRDAISRNKVSSCCHSSICPLPSKAPSDSVQVSQFVSPFNQDGHQFIKTAPRELLETSHRAKIIEARRKRSRSRKVERDFMEMPKIFSHFVLNLPASAISFLSSLKGIYSSHEDMFYPRTVTQMPLIHVYCFELLMNGESAAHSEICRRISEEIGHKVQPGDYETRDQVSIHDVRDVAPNKHMFCATFRLAPEVAFNAT